MALMTGGEFTSMTTTVIVSESINGGTPLSVTRTVKLFVVPPCDSLGVQVNTPLVGLMLAPAGAPESREKVNWFAGISGSLALALKVSRTPSLAVLFPIEVSTGGLFDSRTTTVKVLWALNGGWPLSVTVRVRVLVEGPCASVGVQLKTPLEGLMLAPEGGLSRLKVRVLAGRSESDAVAVKVMVRNS